MQHFKGERDTRNGEAEKNAAGPKGRKKIRTKEIEKKAWTEKKKEKGKLLIHCNLFSLPSY